MKKENKKIFTKLTHSGISLIVLIVTIIVIIILAAAVILTISKNNPIESSKEATFKEDVRNFQDDLTLTISKEYTDKQGQRDEKITTNYYNVIREKIPSFTEKYSGKFEIVDDELVYVGDNEKEIKWCEDIGIETNNWDKYATPETCFQWGSDTPGEDGYNTIIGYNSDLQKYPKVRIPSRCKKIVCNDSRGNPDEIYGRSFLNNIGKIEIPNTVTEIGTYAFGGVHGNALKSVTGITIPDSVTIIEDSAFIGCSSLTNITIPNSVTSIGDYAFSSCSSLENITIPDTVTIIEDGAFNNCSSLTDITIPVSVTSIGDWPFYSCSSLTNITFNGTKSEWNNISKSSAWNLSSAITTITCTDGTITL